MSDSRIDYQPLRTEALDSPSYHRSSDIADPSQGKYSVRKTDSDEDDDAGIHATEIQELVGSSGQDFSEHLRGQQGQDVDVDDEHHTSRADWIIRVQAFLCAALLGVSTHYTLHMTGPLKDVLKESMGISNTQFSLLQSSLTLFPTLIPLIGGLLVERYGTGPSSIVFTTIVILGQIIVVLGCWTRSIKVMITGYCLFGLGAAPITIIQETIWIRYFKKNGLALVLSLGLLSGKLSGFLALATTVPLTTFGFATPFIVSLCISVFAWAMNILFLWLSKKPREDTDAMTKITILLKAKRTNLGWNEVYGFSSMFWTMLAISFLVGASWNPFIHQASNIVKHRYGLNDEQAAWEASVILAVPLVVYPFLGTFIDHAGKRAWLLLVTAGLLISTHVVLMIPFGIVPIPPTIPMLFFALSLSLGTLSIVTSMPVLTKHVPTGLGLHRSIDNIGATLFGTVAGMLQDFPDNEGDGESETESFFYRLYHHLFPAQVDQAQEEREDLQLLGMFLSVAIIAFITCAIFVWGDYHWTDGEGGKTRLVNGVYGKREPIETTATRTRRNRRRRSHEVLEAMTMEAIFELEDEPDAEVVSMTEIGSTHLGFHSSNQQGSEAILPLGPTSEPQSNQSTRYELRHQQLGHPQRRSESSNEDEDLQEEEYEDEQDEYRFGVRIESGDDEVPHFKKVQAHFWIMVWSALLLASWAVFGVGVSR